MKYEHIYFLLCFLLNNKCEAYGNRQRGSFSGHIVGGVEVPIGMYPHVALFYVNKAYMCGGSIVSDRVILTAAHCAEDGRHQKRDPESFQVFVGSSVRGRGAQYRVCKVIVHELHSKGKPFHFYDIAVLILRDQLKFGPTVRKVKIADSELWKNEKSSFTIAGFGATETHSSVANKLLATRMKYVDWKTCNQSQAIGPIVVPYHMFCMIGNRWTSDCSGDSGSGVIWRGYVVGLVSGGRDSFCGSDMMPSMYTNVYYFRKWIMSKIKEADSLKKQDCPARTRYY